ncbi:NADPH-dependent F420 reductase [Agromyces sp. M3QZ16-3]|uniref:NADPH-dependent F420 reductase n=1 Tax=Agromyces sp. M3QZ16-3 TaxID=3447585 RepID=UPI003F68FCB8
MRIAIIGHGRVGGALAIQFARLGEEVVLGLDPGRPDTSEELRQRESRLTAAPMAEAASTADLVLVALPFKVLEAVVAPLASALAGRIVVDATNPVGPGLTHALGSERSAADDVASLAPEALVVKAFNIYGAENYGDPPEPVGSVRPAMLIAGDDADAKRTVSGLLERMGWQPLDVGPRSRAVHLEHLTLLWLGLVRAGDHRPDLTWGALHG